MRAQALSFAHESIVVRLGFESPEYHQPLPHRYELHLSQLLQTLLDVLFFTETTKRD